MARAAAWFAWHPVIIASVVGDCAANVAVFVVVACCLPTNDDATMTL